MGFASLIVLGLVVAAAGLWGIDGRLVKVSG
jgi:hypothetical protein